MNALDSITNLIRRISPQLEIIHHDYCLIGSAALLLSGIPVPVHDLDIHTSSENADKLKRLWIAWTSVAYRPEQPDLFRSNFGRFDFPELSVEVMGDLEVNRSGSWQIIAVTERTTIDLNGYSINIPTLKEQKRIFQMLGRAKDLEKAARIK